MVICNLLNEQAAKAMADAKVYLVPTLATYEALANDELEHWLSTEMLSKVYDVLEAGKESIRIAQEAGVVMCFGTDCLADTRQHQLREFVLLHEAGMPMDECLRSATINAAQLIHVKENWESSLKELSLTWFWSEKILSKQYMGTNTGIPIALQ